MLVAGHLSIVQKSIDVHSTDSLFNESYKEVLYSPIFDVMVFFKKIGGHRCPFCGVTNSAVLDFWFGLLVLDSPLGFKARVDFLHDFLPAYLT